MRKVVGFILLVFAFTMFGIGGYMLYDKFQGYEENEEIYAQVADVAIQAPIKKDENGEIVEETITPEEIQEKIETEEEFTEFTINWESLKDYNVVGWVKYGTQINYPIVQEDDNSYYLKHAYDGTYNANGAIFMNSKNDGDFRDDNTIIYGHNLRSGKMFGTIKNFKEKGEGPDSFAIYQPDGTKHTYKVLSIAEVKDAGVAYQYSFSSLEKYKEYQTAMKNVALFNTGVDIDTSKKVVTLSTCRSTGSSEGWRVVVVGIETEIEKIQDAASWYEKPMDEHPSITPNTLTIEEQDSIMQEEKRKEKEEELEHIVLEQ